MIDQALFVQPSVPVHSDTRIERFNFVELRWDGEFSASVDKSPFPFIDDGTTLIVPHTEIDGSHSFGKLLHAFKLRVDRQRCVVPDEAPFTTKHEHHPTLEPSIWTRPYRGKAFRKILNARELR